MSPATLAWGVNVTPVVSPVQCPAQVTASAEQYSCLQPLFVGVCVSVSFFEPPKAIRHPPTHWRTRQWRQGGKYETQFRGWVWQREIKIKIHETHSAGSDANLAHSLGKRCPQSYAHRRPTHARELRAQNEINAKLCVRFYFCGKLMENRMVGGGLRGAQNHGDGGLYL